MKRILLMLFALAVATTAAAQAYKWVDQDGKVRYGDTPPPGVKATPLRAPKAPSASSVDAKKDPAAKDGAAKKDEKPLTPEQAFQKRQKERQEADQKAEKERTAAAENRQNCEAARANLRNLQSGARISTVDKSGERVYLEDEQRNAAVAQAQRSVDEWCK